MFLGITDLPAYVAGAAAIILVPGPNSMFVLKTATQRGVRAGYQAAGGVILGDAILTIATVSGVASLLRAFPAIFTVIKYAGAAYLAYVGAAMLVAAIVRWRKGANDAPAPEQRQSDPKANPFIRAFTVSLVNPKAILFLVSFFTQFVDPNYAHPGLAFLIEALILEAFSVTYLSALIFGGTFLANVVGKNPRLSAAGSSAVGTLFLGFSVKLVG